MSAPVLVADVGGTNVRFALAEGPALRTGSVRETAVGAFPSLPAAARDYLDAIGAHPRRAVIAVAGKVDGDEARITNHPWVVSAARTRRALGLDAVRLVNDFTAQAMAIPGLGAGDVVAIGGVGPPARDDGGDRVFAVIGPGTGLGVGGLLRRDGRWHPLETEGGHVGFAPGTPEEIAILQALAPEFGRVSVERLVSGGGLVNLHRALSVLAGADPGPMTPPDVTAGAAAGDPRCARAVDVFCEVFGACAGDVALTLGAWDGVFLAGGLVPRLLPTLRHSGFRARFEHKGRFAPTMARIPTLAVVHPQPGLLGAAAIAASWDHEA